MKQLNVFCEGQTEQGFCDQVLRPHLFPSGDGVLHTLAVGEKDHHHLYGIGRTKKYARVRKFIHNTIKQREGNGVYFTTLFDLYALPADFPGKAATSVTRPTRLPTSSPSSTRSRRTSGIIGSSHTCNSTSSKPSCSSTRTRSPSRSRTVRMRSGA